MNGLDQSLVLTFLAFLSIWIGEQCGSPLSSALWQDSPHIARRLFFFQCVLSIVGGGLLIAAIVINPFWPAFVMAWIFALNTVFSLIKRYS